MKKLAIITTHPIQYNAPWFKMLAEQPNLQVKVFYTWSQRQTDFHDKDFGQNIQWDIPLLEGYDYEWIPNTAKHPTNKKFFGIKCPTLIEHILAFTPTHTLFYGWNFHAHYKAMRYFKGKIPVLFRGDSTLLDYEYRSLKDVLFRDKVNSNKVTSNKVTSQQSSVTSHKSLVTKTTSYLKYKLRKTLLTKIYKSIDHALYVGQSNKDYFSSLSLPNSALHYVPHAIDNQHFADTPEKNYEQKAANWRKKLGIAPSDYVLLFAGKLDPKKNPLILLEAIKQLNNLKLIIAGSGPLEESLKTLAQTLAHYVIFIPFQNQSQMPLLYRLANLFILPSQGPGETWGLAVNEAIVSNRNILVSDKCGIHPEINRIFGPNHVFQYNNIYDLTQKIKYHINSKTRQPTTDNRQLFLSEFSFTTKTQNLIKLLNHPT